MNSEESGHGSDSASRPFLWSRGQGFVLWITGLPASGKTTLAAQLKGALERRNIPCAVLDGDGLRRGLCKDLGFSARDRAENVRRAGEVARLMVEAGVLVVAAFISPYRADRAQVRGLFPKGKFFEVYLQCSVETCERRDPKGLYRKAREGTLTAFTGVSDPYEPPVNPELLLATGEQTVEESFQQLFDFVAEHCIDLNAAAWSQQ